MLGEMIVSQRYGAATILGLGEKDIGPGKLNK
jgi:hypothetical protein